MMTDIQNGMKPAVFVINPRYDGLRDFILSSIRDFDHNGSLVYKGRNELRSFINDGVEYVFKSFRQPHIVNALVYGHLRSSKAKRSYDHAFTFMRAGVGTPMPVAYLEFRKGMLLTHSFYVSLASECQYTYNDLFTQSIAYKEDVCREIGRITAKLHSKGYAHKDYGRGNILFGMVDGKLLIEVVDLNRLRTGAPLDVKEGCKNFERLPATSEMHRWMADEYASARGFDAQQCFELMEHYRSRQPDKIDGLY